MTPHLQLVPGARTSATVTMIHADTDTRAMAGALSAGLDWPRKLRHAQVLSTSADPRHRRLAEHIRDAAALHEAGLLKPAPLDLTPDMRVRGKVTVIEPPPYSAGTGKIRRVLIGTAAMVAVVWLGLVAVMI